MKRTWTYFAVMLTLAAALALLSKPGGVESQEQSVPDGWQTFNDPMHGYSLSYPPGWEAQTVFENATGEPYIIRRRVAFHDPQGGQMELDVWWREPNTPMDQWFQEVESVSIPVESNAVIAGQEAYLLVDPGGCGVPVTLSAYIPFEDRIYKIYSLHNGDGRSLDLYETILRSFSLVGVEAAAQRQTLLPDLQPLLPSACGTNLCPSTCWGECTFAAISEGCCGYHAVPKWQCSKQCNGEQIGDFLGNCVWWGAYTRRDVGALASGNAENWAISVRNTGQLPIDTTPKVGDIVVHPGSSYNHVAYVVWVSPDGTSYKMSDMGWCADCGPSPEETKLRTVDEDDEFIHCKGDPAIPTIDWSFTDCPFGWTPSKGFTASGLSGSGWDLNPGQDPFLLSPILSVSTSEYNSIEITMANSAADTSGRIYFTTDSIPGFDEIKAVGFAITSDGSSRAYVVNMSHNPQWQNTITRLRLDPVGAGNDDGSSDDIEISRIRFLYVEPRPLEPQVYLPLVLRDYGVNRPPHVPSDPSPADGATDQQASLTLTWIGGDPDGDAVSYDVYLDAGETTPQTRLCEGVTDRSCDPGALITGTHYYWQVIATDEHSATTAGPVWAFTTSTTICVESLANGGFEKAGDWEIPATAYPAGYTTAKSHSGDRSMRVGIVDPTDDIRSYSSARQLVSIAGDANSAALRYWLYTVSEESATSGDSPLPLSLSPEEVMLASDAQYVLILDENNKRLETVLWQRQDVGDWTYHEADLKDYVGETIKLQFGVYNDGLDGVTGMYVDDVSLLVCSP
ncbi:MAG TPA: CHAP domain-containing protein [Anaerolineae bacterium]|nr:CHAP domain-containing protein [Anaerolineae bacterium]